MKLCDHCGRKATFLDYSLQTPETRLFQYDLCEGCRPQLDEYLAEACKVWQQADRRPPHPSQVEDLRVLSEPQPLKSRPEQAAPQGQPEPPPEPPKNTREARRQRRAQQGNPQPEVEVAASPESESLPGGLEPLTNPTP